MSEIMEKWKKLFAVATQFKEQKYWKYFDGDKIFGVQNPTSGEIGYCIVMGYYGEIFGLAVYLGIEGLANIKEIHGQGEKSDTIFQQRCLNVTFEDRLDLHKRDYRLIKDLGLGFRGKKEWPQFRSLQPGFCPWFLEEEEIEFLTLAIEQAIQLCERVKENTELLDSAEENRYLIRVSTKDGEEVQWYDEWQKIDISPRLHQKMKYQLDELRLQRIKRNFKVRNSTWEMDYFLAPLPIQEEPENPPYYPYLFLATDLDSGQILNFELNGHDHYRERFVDWILDTMEERMMIPRFIVISRVEISETLELISRKLGVVIKVVDEFIMLEEAKFGLYDILE